MRSHPFWSHGSTCTFGLAGLSAQTLTADREDTSAAIADAVAAAEVAEAAGLDAVWATEHHFAADGYLPSPWILLAAIAARTDRVVLGTSVALPGLHHPIRLAEDLFVLDHVSAGRLVAGFGLGYRRQEFEALGRDVHDRRTLLVSSIETLRKAAAGVPVVGDAGVEVSVSPPPPRPAGPPILVGAFAEAGVRRAARLADGFIAPDMPLRHFDERLRWLADEGVLTRDFAVVLTLSGFVGDPSTAEPGIRHVHRQYARWLHESGDGVIDAGTADRSDAVPGHLAVGSPAQVIDALAPYVEGLTTIQGHGPRHVCLRLTYPGVPTAANLASVERFRERRRAGAPTGRWS